MHGHSGQAAAAPIRGARVRQRALGFGQEGGPELRGQRALHRGDRRTELETRALVDSPLKKREVEYEGEINKRKWVRSRRNIFRRRQMSEETQAEDYMTRG